MTEPTQDTHTDPSSSPLASPVEHQVDDLEVELMIERQQRMGLTGEHRTGMFLPRLATTPHLVSIFPLAGTTQIHSHRDLDIFQWLPGHPYKLEHFTSVDDYRIPIDIPIKKSTRKKNHYIVLYYKQVDDLLTKKSFNYLINELQGGEAVDIGDDMLIIKVTKRGQVVDMNQDDVENAPTIIQKFVSYLESKKQRT